MFFNMYLFCLKGYSETLKELRNERAAAQTDVTRKCALQASFYCSTNMVLHLF